MAPQLFVWGFLGGGVEGGEVLLGPFFWVGGVLGLELCMTPCPCPCSEEPSRAAADKRAAPGQGGREPVQHRDAPAARGTP